MALLAEATAPSALTSPLVGNEVVALRYGTRMTTRSDVFLNYDTYREPDGPIAMEYYLWVVRSAEHTVVVDCGFNDYSGSRRGREMLCPPVECLGRLGIDPAAVTALVITHGHYDHMGNLGAFPECQVVIARDEYDFWTSPDGDRRLFAISRERSDVADLRRVHEEGRLVMVEGSYDLAPGVAIEVVGGHTPGQLMVLAETSAGTAVVASDAVHYYEEYTADRPYRHAADLRAMYRAFDRIREITGDDDRLLVAGHDPAVLDRFPAYSADTANIARRIA